MAPPLIRRHPTIGEGNFPDAPAYILFGGEFRARYMQKITEKTLGEALEVVMYFRSTQDARKLMIMSPNSEEMVIHHGGPHDVVVRLRNAILEERKIGSRKGAQSPKLDCYASSCREVNDAVYAMFQSVRRGELPKGSMVPKYEEWIYYGLPEPDVGPGADPPPPLPDPPPPPQAPPQLRWMPPRFKDFFSDVQDELHQAVQQTVSALRWRSAIKGPHSSLSTPAIEWSFDGQTWEGFEDDGSGLRIRVPDSTTVRVTDALRADVERFISQGTPEPIGHELFREAWALRRENPRSSLVIGVAALEVGLKELMADLDPEASWVSKTKRKSPVKKILREHLQLLPPRFPSDGKILPLTEALTQGILQTLEGAVDLRNEAVHEGKGVETEELREILPAIEDVLWLLDYYRGFEWALGHLRQNDPYANF